MRRLFSFAAACVAIVVVAGCGGKQSMASKSANAYRDAVARGVPVGAGGHGGHTASGTDHAGMTGMDMKSMDHSKMPPMDMKGMDHSKMTGMDMKGMDHSKMTGMDMKGMDHSKMAGMDMKGMDHSKMAGMDMKGMDHSKMAGMDMKGMDHSKIAGMQHGGMHMGGNIPPGGLWGGLDAQQRGTAAAAGHAQPMNPPVVPSSTLMTDPQDAPSPLSISEAEKAAAQRKNEK